MKVLHVISSLDPQGGGLSFNLLNLVPALKDYSVESIILSIDNNSDFFHGHSGLKKVTVPGPIIGKYRFNLHFPFILFREASRCDIVIVHGLWQFHSAIAGLLLPFSGIPYIVQPHGMLDPWFNTFLFKKIKKRIYWAFFEGFLVKNASCMLFTDSREASKARNSFHPYNDVEEVCPIGLNSPPDLSGLCFGDTSFSSDLSRPYILFLGRIHPKKGVDLLLKAFAKVQYDYPDFDLCIAGPDQIGWQADLRYLASCLGIARKIKWLGMVDGLDKWLLLKYATCFVLPSFQENFGIAIVEALSVSTPVIVSESVDISDSIESSSAGKVCLPNVESLSRSLFDFLGSDMSDKEKMGRAARKLFLASYESASAAKRICSILHKYS